MNTNMMIAALLGAGATIVDTRRVVSVGTTRNAVITPTLEQVRKRSEAFAERIERDAWNAAVEAKRKARKNK